MDLHHQDTIAQLPNNIRAALSKFSLESKTVVYAVCPACHCTFAPKFTLGDPTPKYPSLCNNRATPEAGECQQQLLTHDSGTPATSGKPIKPFLYHSFHDYLAGLLSRKDLEAAMDKSCDDLLAATSKPPPSVVTDVWEAQFLRTFGGPKIGTRFIDRGHEGRYGFALNVDFFNVDGMRVRGSTASCGLISMACLNLPPDLRYKPENMYMVIIPGPRMPLDIALNHYIRPLVDDMVQSWDKGVRYSRTALHPGGRVTRSAVIVAVNDLPAARHTAQLASHSAHIYCTTCQCSHRSTLGRVDYENWELRDNEIIRAKAEDWLHASSSKDRTSIFDTYGTRWSELWRLRYWNVVRQLTVDAMHCLLEGLIHAHFRYFLGLNAAEAAAPITAVPAFSHNFVTIDDPEQPPDEFHNKKHAKLVQTIHRLLTAALEGENDENAIEHLRKRLHDKPLVALQFVCNDLALHPQAKQGKARRYFKKDWVDQLVNWVSICSFY